MFLIFSPQEWSRGLIAVVIAQSLSYVQVFVTT